MWMIVAALSGVLGVAAGAFGAHGLKGKLSLDQLASWSTACEYQILHSIALLALALYAQSSGRAVTLPASLFTAGIVLFSGSIYLLLLTRQSWLGPITPLGGLCLMAGWISLVSLRA